MVVKSVALNIDSLPAVGKKHTQNSGLLDAAED
jgi:hypothetical protein